MLRQSGVALLLDKPEDVADVVCIPTLVSPVACLVVERTLAERAVEGKLRDIYDLFRAAAFCLYSF